MKYEWKKSLSRILIAAMLLCTMQGNVVAAATELSDAVDAVDAADVVDVSGGTVPADALLKDVNENGDKLIEDIRSEVLVDVDGDAEGSVLDIPAPRTSDYTIELKKTDFDLISFHNSLINLAANYPSQVVKIGEEGAQEYDFSVDVDAGDSDNSYIEVCFRKNQLELASEDNEMNYAEIRLSGESGTIPVGSYTLTPNVTDLKSLRFTFYNVVWWMHNCDSVTQKGPRGFVVAGVTDPVDTIEPTLVLNGQPLSTAIGTLPEVVNTGYKLKHWVVIEGGIAGTTEITINSVITQPSIEVSAIWEEDAPHVHNWEFDTLSENVTWIGNDTDGYKQASIKKTCKSCHRTVSVSAETELSVDGIACSKDAVRHYTAVFNSSVDKDIDGTFTYTKTVSGPYEKHIWKVDSVTSNGSFEVAPTEAYLNLVCEREASHLETVSASKIELLSSNELSKEYQYTGTSSDGQTVSGTQEFFDHTEHKWTVSFNWISISSNKADTNVTAEATCKVGGEKKSLEVTLDDKQVGSKIEYTAKATDPAGKVWTSKKNFDPKTCEVKDGPAGTPTANTDIVIIGVEETYPYTGSKIRPAVTVMDGDIVLAQSTDYTVSYTGKNNIGEINKVEVKGKGNYAGKSATAQFKIVDPREEVDKDKLADKVSKVSVNTKKFTYNGKAQYPSEVTVTLKDNSTIVYKVDEDGKYTTDSDKKVGLSFSNNINKGTATVAAMGNDGKVKKASYTIAAAEIGSAEFEISAVDWAVKAATPEIKATIKLGDEDVELVAGQDYKVSFKAKEAGENKGTAKISGKGNFKGKHADVTYTVTPMEITESNIVVKAIAGKKAKDVKVTVNDAFGNALNKKFYTVEIQNAEGTALNKGDALPEKIKVVVKGANAAVTTGDDGVTVDVEPAGDIAKVKGAFKVDKNFYKTYTGEPITIKADDFGAGKINVGNLKFGKDFRIVAYKNNIKKGTMTVTVQGEGEYSGTKTFKVKIKPRPFDKEAPKN